MEAKWHFSDLPVAVQVQLVVGGPLLFGAICGFLLGETATGWWVSQAVAAIGGFAAGLDHPDARSAALRGLTGGTLFGWGIVAADAISDNAHTAEAVHPIGLIVILTGVTGCLLAALGGWVRARAASPAARCSGWGSSRPTPSPTTRTRPRLCTRSG